MMRNALAVLLACFALQAAATDIRAIEKSLRAEPLSLFDWGLFMLEDELQSVRRHGKDFIRVAYEPAQKRVVVDGVFMVEQAEVDDINAYRACYMRHHAIKLTLGVIDTDRIHIAPAADFRLGMKFSHHNSDAYPDMPDAAALGAGLLESIYVKVSVVTDIDEFPFVVAMRCEGRLLSQDVKYGGSMIEDMTM